MSFFHDITKISDNALNAMQKATHDRLIEEDTEPPQQAKIYGVHEYNDWKEQCDEMETELNRCSIPYVKAPW